MFVNYFYERKYKPMNKTDLINVVAAEANLSKKDADAAVLGASALGWEVREA